MKNKFAERLKEILITNNISQSELAKKLNVKPNVISRYCSGNREPSFDMLLSICEELDETPSYMLGFDDK